MRDGELQLLGLKKTTTFNEVFLERQFFLLLRKSFMKCEEEEEEVVLLAPSDNVPAAHVHSGTSQPFFFSFFYFTPFYFSPYFMDVGHAGASPVVSVAG